MFGVNGGEFLILLVLAMIVVGPERLPRYAAELGRGVRRLRGYVAVAKERVAEESGVDWEELDPRRYDPRRIVREALAEPLDAPAGDGGAAADGSTVVRGARPAPRRPGPAPFDDEAT